MSGVRTRLVALVGCLAVLAVLPTGAAAAAENRSATVPTNLTQTFVSTHFIIHFDPRRHHR